MPKRKPGVSRWWSVRCTRCRWANSRKGTRDECSKHGCPKCGGSITITAGTPDTRQGDSRG